MKISEFVKNYFTRPLVIWGIFFNIIIKLTFLPQVFDFVAWIIISQAYLPIFFGSFIFTYLQQMLPIRNSMNQIKEKQRQNHWTVPQIMSNRIYNNVFLWVSAVLFFAGILMVFGTIEPKLIADNSKFLRLKFTLPMIGFVLLPAVAVGLTLHLESIIRTTGIEINNQIDTHTWVPIVVGTFFLALDYIIFF